VSNFHADFVKLIAHEMKPAIYVELGIGDATTLNAVAGHCGASYAVDIAPGVMQYQKDNIKSFCMTTDSFHEEWDKNIRTEIDLIFVDACHKSDYVFRDVINFYPWLKKDTGIMILHDTWPPNLTYAGPEHCDDAYKATSRLSGILPDCELMTIPLEVGLTLIRRRGDDWRNL
jgi:hypothetical protein